MSFVSFSDYCVFITILILHRIILGLLLSMCDFQSKFKKFSRPRSSKILIWKFFCSFISSFSIHWYTEKNNSEWIIAFEIKQNRGQEAIFFRELKKNLRFFLIERDVNIIFFEIFRRIFHAKDNILKLSLGTFAFL